MNVKFNQNSIGVNAFRQDSGSVNKEIKANNTNQDVSGKVISSEGAAALRSSTMAGLAFGNKENKTTHEEVSWNGSKRCVATMDSANNCLKKEYYYGEGDFRESVVYPNELKIVRFHDDGKSVQSYEKWSDLDNLSKKIYFTETGKMDRIIDRDNNTTVTFHKDGKTVSSLDIRDENGVTLEHKYYTQDGLLCSHYHDHSIDEYPEPIKDPDYIYPMLYLL